MKNNIKLYTLCSLIISSTANAAGSYLYETNTTDIALASAGMAARAQDASVMAANPAGISNINTSSFTTNLINLYGDSTLYTANGGDAGNIIGHIPIGSVFYSQPFNDELSLGLGIYGNYGMSLQYDNLFDAIDIPTATNQAITIQPSIAYKFNDHFSVGFALGIQYGIFELEAQVKNNPKSKIKDTDTQINGKIGLIYNIDQRSRLGLAYTNETKFEFQQDTFSTTSVAPQQIIFSAYHEINDRVAVMGNINWQDWSTHNTMMNVDVKDTYQLAIGTQYHLNQKFKLNAGVAFDSSMYDQQSRGDLTLPTGNTYRIGTGVDYRMSDSSTLAFAFEIALIDSSQVTVGNSQLARFEDPALYFLSFGYHWSK